MLTSSVEKSAHTALVLANAGEVVAGVIKEIAGNDISNSINGSKITSELIHSMAFHCINKCLEEEIRTQ